MATKKNNKIAFQGTFGAYSHKACIEAFPKMEPLPCKDFASAFKAVESGKAAKAMIPIDNSIAGRVADIHHLLQETKLQITAECFIPIHHCLLAVDGAEIKGIKTVYSHTHAIPQCRKFITKHKMKAVAYEDTAASAQKVSEMGDTSIAAIASAAAAELYGLRILKHSIEDEPDNVTRFIVLEKDAKFGRPVKDKEYITSLLFSTRNIPAALYKALGGFASNGINITKIESYLGGSKFQAASFYCEIESHPSNPLCLNAFEELLFFTSEVVFLGTYEKHSYRSKQK